MNRPRTSRKWFTMLLTLFATVAPASATADEGGKPDKLWVYVGTYTRGESKGIYLYELSLRTGKLKEVGLAGAVKNPSFLAIHPSRRYLYAVSEISDLDGKRTGGVSAFTIDPKTGKLTLLNQQPSQGAGPCHLVVDKDGKNVLVANYGGGSIAAIPVGEGGKLAPPSDSVQHKGKSVNPRRQERPHAHSINLDPAGKYAFAADLGLDKVLIYRFDPAKGKLTPNDPDAAKVPPGSGPRHFAFHPGGRHAYVINELTSTVTAFAYDPKEGSLKAIQTVTTLPEGFKGNNSTAEVVVHPSGQFLYGSNRGHDSIAIFKIDEKTGKLTPAGHTPTGGKTPRNFNIDPTGAYLLAANQGTNDIFVFRIDQTTGKLTPTGQKVEVPSPVCVKFLIPPS